VSCFRQSHTGQLCSPTCSQNQACSIRPLPPLGVMACSDALSSACQHQRICLRGTSGIPTISSGRRTGLIPRMRRRCAERSSATYRQGERSPRPRLASVLGHVQRRRAVGALCRLSADANVWATATISWPTFHNKPRSFRTSLGLIEPRKPSRFAAICCLFEALARPPENRGVPGSSPGLAIRRTPYRAAGRAFSR
jgi:hypothetical protein